MAPMKRARSIDDDDEVIAVESASSNLRVSGANKKARLTVNQDETKSRRERSASTSSSEDELPNAAEEDTSAPAATQYEILRDNGFRHLENAEADDAIATQKFHRKRGQIGQNVAAENAIIEEVTCLNFMCHVRLNVQLSPLINFVVGVNGSGKSAVLTAVTLCLGGKASATNRGSSLKDLIRTGQDSAMLSVRLKNEGSDAYQPDLYGDSITVERHFSRSGTSGFRLKSAAGRTISTKKGDVDEIIEYFNLQVDNPMNVLTQDAAKSFIQNSTPSQKYKFFVEGVQLQQLDNDYRMVADICDAIDARLGDMKKNIKDHQKTHAAAEQRAKIVHEHKGMKEGARKLREQLVWIQIEEEEARLERRESNIVAAQEAIAEAERDVESKSAAFDQVESTLANAASSIQQLEDELVPLKGEEEAAKDALDATTQDIVNLKTEQRTIKSNMKEAQKNVDLVTKSIDEEQRRIEDANGGANARKLAEIEEAQQLVSNSTQALGASDAEGPQLAQRLQSAEDELRNIAIPLSAKREEVKSTSSKLHQLTTKQPNVMDGFDPKMLGLLKEIREHRGFLETPVGPVGLHIKLLKPLWSDMIESLLGKNLNGFIVTSKADQVILSKMLDRRNMGSFCPISIGNKRTFNINEPDPQYDTILRVLEFDNDLVRRSLIIQASIEQALLIRWRTDAYKAMFDGAKPVNVKSCYALHDVNLNSGHSFKGNGAIDPVQFKHNRPRMKTDSQSQVQHEEVRLRHLQGELKELEARQKNLQQAANDCKSAVQKHQQSHKGRKATLQKAEDRVEALQLELDNNNVQDGRLDAFRLDLAEAQNELNICQESYKNTVTEMDKLSGTATARKAELEAVKLRVADQTAKIKKATIKVNNMANARRNVLLEKNQAHNQLQHVQEKLSTAKIARDTQAQSVVDNTAEATAICQRVAVPPGKTHAGLEAQYKKIAEQLKMYNKRLGATDEEVMLALEEALRNLQTLENNCAGLFELHGLLKQSFHKRMDQFRRFQRHISSRSRIAFSYLLSNRAFRGKLMIDHKNKKLDVHVEPDETTKSGKGRQTKTLSGGEKSFSSICLLLALWEAMGAPLRCLDEYDVFMDDINRDVSTKMIIDAARHSAGRQYIMITPKALGSGAADADDVKIHKLDDPREKGQKSIEDSIRGD